MTQILLKMFNCNCYMYFDNESFLTDTKIVISQKMVYVDWHSIIFLGEMQIQFSKKIVSTIVIFEKKMFQIMCHMIGLHHY